MSIIELFLLSIGLAMDTFAVGICIGLTIPKITLKKALTVGLYFGIFQAAMPVIGYFTAMIFAARVIAYGSWIAFGLLCFLGIKMIIDSLKKEDCPEKEHSLKFAKMLPLAIATSIDALAVGVSFAFIEVRMVPAVLLIGITTLLISMIGVKTGNIFGRRFKAQAQILGGIILILLGGKILLEYLGVI